PGASPSSSPLAIATTARPPPNGYTYPPIRPPSPRPILEPISWCHTATASRAECCLTAAATIGGGHVSGRQGRLCHLPRAGMEIRRPGADQNRERLKPVDPNCFSWPRPVRSVCLYRSSTSL